jgi:hypothetical protein
MCSWTPSQIKLQLQHTRAALELFTPHTIHGHVIDPLIPFV